MLFLFFVPLQPKFTQIMRQTILWGLLILTCSLSAQNDAFEAFRKQQAEKFKQTKDNQQAQYDAFRKRANEQYARFMREPWTAFDEQQEDTVRQEPAMPPVIMDEALTLTSEPTAAIAVSSEVEVLPAPVAAPIPIAPVKPQNNPAKMVLHKQNYLSFLKKQKLV